MAGAHDCIQWCGHIKLYTHMYVRMYILYVYMYVCLCKSVWWKNKSPSQLLLDQAGSSCFFFKAGRSVFVCEFLS